MAEFHHPYNFIPVTGKINGNPPDKLAFDAIRQGNTASGARHDLWLPGTYSGRVICRLHLNTPTVVGAKQCDQGETEPKYVTPYQRDNRPAIPGSSLRGMIGAIAETLSQSALRILDNNPYTVRKPVGGGLSALGMLMEVNEPGQRFGLIPLTIPVLKQQSGQFQLDETWSRIFKIPGGKKAPLRECLAAYIDGYKSIQHDGETRLQLKPDSFLAKVDPAAYAANGPYYYARLAGVPNQPVDQSIYTSAPGLCVHGNYLLGQQLAEANAILTTEAWQALPCTEQQQYTRGMLRVLGIAGRETTMPPTKKHELFIPEPSTQRLMLPVPDKVIDRFKLLAQERTEAESGFPFTLKGYHDWEPRSRNLYYFDIELKDGKVQVSEISISAIWRRQIDTDTYEFFRRIDPDLLPWQPGRNHLTPAELLFGVVDEEKDTQEKQGRALASRLRFADALPLATEQFEQLPPVTLKILSSPKPPSPALYFHPDGQRGHYVAKMKLSKEGSVPNGRKVYLHHPEQQIQERYWETQDVTPELNKQKLRCIPLPEGHNFYFHVDFDNLSAAELSLLLVSLRPAEPFRHRLGLGKSLGLGTVRVDIEGVFFIDRQIRYGRDALEQPRYQRIWSAQAVTGDLPWQERYPAEAQRLQELATAGGLTPQGLQEADFYTPALIDNTTHALLVTVGDPSRLRPGIPVQPPLLNNQLNGAAAEQETFKWFVENDKKAHQAALQPVKPNQPLPVLQTYPPPA